VRTCSWRGNVVGAFHFTVTFSDASSHGGNGQQVLTAVNTSNIHYVLNAANSDDVDKIQLDIDATGKSTGTAFVNANDGQTGGSGDYWYSCDSASVGTLQITCDTTSPQLHVSDVGSGTTPGKLHLSMTD
jgi:hypothetical protein